MPGRRTPRPSIGRPAPLSSTTRGTASRRSRSRPWSSSASSTWSTRPVSHASSPSGSPTLAWSSCRGSGTCPTSRTAPVFAGRSANSSGEPMLGRAGRLPAPPAGRDVLRPGPVGATLEVRWAVAGPGTREVDVATEEEQKRAYKQYRSTKHNHCIHKGFVQRRHASMLRSFLLELRHLSLDHPRIDPVAPYLVIRALLLHLPQQPPIPLLEPSRGRTVTCRQPALEAPEAPHEREPIRVEPRRPGRLAHQRPDHEMPQRHRVDLLDHTRWRLAPQVRRLD